MPLPERDFTLADLHTQGVDRYAVFKAIDPKKFDNNPYYPEHQQRARATDRVGELLASVVIEAQVELIEGELEDLPYLDNHA